MQIWEVPYDIDGFKPLGKRMRLFGGGGGGKAAAAPPGSMTKMAIGAAEKRPTQQAKSPAGAARPTSLMSQAATKSATNASPSLRDTTLKNTLLGE